MKKINIPAGFTLIELTIVMGIFIVIGTIIVTILNSTFKGNTQTRSTNEISQNGNYALSIMTNLLRNSSRFNSIQSTCAATDFSTCCNPAGASGKSITFTGLDGGVTTLTCNDSGSNPTYSISSSSASFAPASLLDTSQARLSSTGSCTFICTQADEYSPPRIDISFTLQNASGDGASANFKTSVSLRNQNLR